MSEEAKVVGSSVKFSGISLADGLQMEDLALVGRGGVGFSSSIANIASTVYSGLCPTYDILSASMYWINGKDFYKEVFLSGGYTRSGAVVLEYLEQHYPWILYRDLKTDRLVLTFKKYSLVVGTSLNWFISEGGKNCIFNGIFTTFDANMALFALPGDVLELTPNKISDFSIYPVLPHVLADGDPS